VISALWFVGDALLPLAPSVGIGIIYLAVVVFAFTKLNNSRNEEGVAEAVYLIVGATSVIALIEFASAYSWVTAAFWPNAFIGTTAQSLEADLTYAAYPIAPILLLIIMTSWLWVPILERRKRTFLTPGHISVVQPNTGRAGLSPRRQFLLSLDVLAILCVLVFYFLYAAGQLWVVGVDSQLRYIIPLNTLNNLGMLEGVRASLNRGHGIYLALLFTIERATGLSAFVIVKYAILPLTFLTSAFTFVAFRSARPRNLGLPAALCAILWIPTTIGIWGGIQANWMAYAVWMLFLEIYLNAAGKMRLTSFVSLSLLSVLVLALHPWTWGVFLAILILAALPEIRDRANLNHALASILSATCLAVPTGIVGLIYISGMRVDITSALSLYLFPLIHSDAVFRLFPGAWAEMWRVWSSFLSPALILISLVGAVALKELQGRTKRYLLSWAFVWCLGSILVAPISYHPTNPAISETQLWRMLYLSPLPILLALGVSKCASLGSRFTLPVQPNFSRLQPVVLLAAVGASSLPLSVFTTPLIRLGAVVVGTLAVALLIHRVRLTDSAKIMIVMVLFLIIVNATFRSLFPLLLDPHNLYPSSSI
jgi:hypothetical protein